MADNTTRILNLTPLTFGHADSYIQPFQEKTGLPFGQTPLIDGFGIVYSLDLKTSDFIIDPDSLLTMPIAGLLGTYDWLALDVQNNTGRFVNAYRRPLNNQTASYVLSMPPGHYQRFDVTRLDTFFFRASFTDELVGVVRIGQMLPPSSADLNKRVLVLTLTDDYLRGWG